MIIEPSIFILGEILLFMGATAALFIFGADNGMKIMALLILSGVVWLAISVIYHPPDLIPIWEQMPKKAVGEILHFYANGTAMVDNGTLINISSIPGRGCP